MKYALLIVVAVLAVILILPVLLYGGGKGGAVPEVVWDMKALGLLDSSNSSFEIANETVHVNPLSKQDKCPAGLGNIVQGKPNVDRIVIDYPLAQKGAYYLHVTWNPGGSGTEQFEVLCNDTVVASSEARTGGSGDRTDVFEVPHQRGENTLTLRRLSGDGMHFSGLALTSVREPSAAPQSPPPVQATSQASSTAPSRPTVQTMKPSLKYPTVAAYSAAIGEQGMLLTSEHVYFYAPQSANASAQIIFPYLVRAYDELKAITGIDTEYIMTVYHFPPGNEEGWGGTANCEIQYGYDNLYLDRQEEWTKHRVPHVSGYIEEMAHSFVGTFHLQFGWEMVGWSLGVAAIQKVADNPIFEASLQSTRQGQKDTYNRYMAAGGVLPSDVEANQVDRIHAYILWQCEQRYGPRFWPDFFAQARAQQAALAQAVNAPGGDDGVRDLRYQLSVDCFDRLPGLGFKELLQSSHISLTHDVRTLRPTEPGWNRRLQ